MKRVQYYKVSIDCHLQLQLFNVLREKTKQLLGKLFSQIVEKCRIWPDQNFTKGTLQIELNQKQSKIVQNREFRERYGYIYIYIYIYICLYIGIYIYFCLHFINSTKSVADICNHIFWIFKGTIKAPMVHWKIETNMKT